MHSCARSPSCAPDPTRRCSQASSCSTAPHARTVVGRSARAPRLCAADDDRVRQSRASAEGAEVVRANALARCSSIPACPMAYTALAAVQAYHDWDLAGGGGNAAQASPPIRAMARPRPAGVPARGRRPPAGGRSRKPSRARQEPLVADRHGALGMVRYYARDWQRALADAIARWRCRRSSRVAHIGRGRLWRARPAATRRSPAFSDALAIAENPGWLAALAMTLREVRATPRASPTRCSGFAASEATGAFVSIDNYAYIAATSAARRGVPVPERGGRPPDDQRPVARRRSARRCVARRSALRSRDRADGTGLAVSSTAAAAPSARSRVVEQGGWRRDVRETFIHSMKDLCKSWISGSRSSRVPRTMLQREDRSDERRRREKRGVARECRQRASRTPRTRATRWRAAVATTAATSTDDVAARPDADRRSLSALTRPRDLLGGSQAVCFVWHSAERIPISFEAVGDSARAVRMDVRRRTARSLRARRRFTAIVRNDRPVLTMASSSAKAMPDRHPSGSSGRPKPRSFTSPRRTASSPKISRRAIASSPRKRSIIRRRAPTNASTARGCACRGVAPGVGRSASTLDDTPHLAAIFGAAGSSRGARHAARLHLRRAAARQRAQDQGPVILRTSPSGGSRHPDRSVRARVERRRPCSRARITTTATPWNLSICSARSPRATFAPLLAHQTYFARRRRGR